jgi:hypothetical protein
MSICGALIGVFKLIFSLLSLPLTLMRKTSNFILLTSGSIIFFPLFLLVNVQQRLEYMSILEGNMNSPLH